MIQVFFWLPMLAQSTVLLIGDSHLQGPVGEVLAKKLKQNQTLVRVSVCGARFEHYLKSLPTSCGYLYESPNQLTRNKHGSAPRLHEVLKRHDPDWIVVNLGTNELQTKPETMKNQAKQFLNQLKPNQKCVLIGPYDTAKPGLKRNLHKVNQILNELSHEYKCHFIRADHLVTYPQGPYDGIHFPPHAGKQLGEKIYEQLQMIMQEKSSPGSSNPKETPKSHVK